MTPVELAMLFRSILHEAKEEADLPCAKFITSYLIGMPQDADTMQQIEELKQAMAASERGY